MTRSHETLHNSQIKQLLGKISSDEHVKGNKTVRIINNKNSNNNNNTHSLESQAS